MSTDGCARVAPVRFRQHSSVGTNMREGTDMRDIISGEWLLAECAAGDHPADRRGDDGGLYCAEHVGMGGVPEEYAATTTSSPKPARTGEQMILQVGTKEFAWEGATRFTYAEALANATAEAERTGEPIRLRGRVRLNDYVGSPHWGWAEYGTVDAATEPAGAIYRVGYACTVTGSWSGGVQAVVTRDVMERIVADMAALYKATDQTDLILWDGDDVLLISVDEKFGTEIIRQTPTDGLWPVPSWTWGRVNIEDCVEVVQPTAKETRVLVPGRMLADFKAGEITKWTFVPHAGDAGYFGPAAEIHDGDESLDIESSDGEFWIAVQHSFKDDDTLSVTWEE